ncbi:MAG: DNA recombination protein RmuC [Paracoccaceae bacterium]
MDPSQIDPLIVWAGWPLALIAAVLWLTSRAGARAHADRHAVTQAELRELAVSEGSLRQAVARLEAQLDEAAEDRARIASDAAQAQAVLAETLDGTRDELSDMRVANEGLQTSMDERTRAHAREVQHLRELRQEMSARFAELSNQSLAQQGERFGALNHERMDALLKPMRQQVEHFQAELRQAHTAAAQDRARLKAEIDQLSRRSEAVSREAVALTRALKGDKQKQGAWGEMILTTLLEGSGLREGEEYETQVSVQDADGRTRRPDAIVKMPLGRVVVIDAKVSLTAYEAAVNAEDEAERARQIRAHTVAVKAHIDELAGRDYSASVAGAVDYTLMFMPVEGALAAALEGQGDLTAYAIEKKVGIATPTTLMVALRTVDHLWTVERRHRNGAEIARRAGLMFDKMAGVIEALDRSGQAIGRAADAHDEAMQRLTRGRGNLVGQFETMRELGARAKAAMPTEFDREPTPPEALPPRDRDEAAPADAAAAGATDTP